MAGPAYIGWAHKRKAGSPDEVSRWEPVARKVLGHAIEEAQRNGLLTYKVVKVIDGVRLIGELVGGIPRYSIEVPPSPAAPVPPRLLEDFVVWPRDAANPDGLDPGDEHHQLILRRRDNRRWQTYFYDADITGYADFERRKGTYAEAFPDGVVHAGNIDWRSARGEVISWYGPSSRYWPDAFVQPRAQFGRFVFSMGRVLLDTDAYAAASPGQAHGPDRYVLGAAMRQDDGGNWLYVVQSEAKDEPAPPASAYIEDLPDVGCPFTRQDNPGGIYRYRLGRQVDAAGLTHYVVQDGSREKLADLAGNHAEPWFFNQSCSVAHCYVLPVDGWLCHVRGWEGQLEPGFAYQLPDPGQVFREAAITEGGGVVITDTVLTVGSMGPPVQVASDYKGDRRVHATVSNWSKNVYEYTGPGGVQRIAQGSVRWDLCGFDFRAGGGWTGSGADTDLRNDIPNAYGWFTASIVFADLRDDVLVLMTTQTGLTGAGQQMEVLHRGRRIHFEPAGPNGNRFVPQAGTMNAGTYDWQGFNYTVDGHPPYWFVYGTTVYQTTDNAPVNPTYYIVPHVGGSNAGMAWSPYPDAAYFGMTAAHMIFWGDELQSIGAIAPAGFQGVHPDADGHHWVTGCASKDDIIVLSCWRPCSMDAVDPRAWNGDASLSYVTGDTLDDLTGVGDNIARYHPVWRLGLPPITA